MSNNSKFLIGVVIVAIIISVGIQLSVIPITPPTQKQNSIYVRNIDREIVVLDLKEYNYLSNNLKNDIIVSMDSASKQYDVPILLLHAIFRVESDYRFAIDHKRVTVYIKNKRVTTNAIGLGGVMWVFWGDSLRLHKIAEKESDLYVPQVNVRASAYILRTIINKESQTSNEQNIIANIIRKYYGAYSKEYENRMEIVTSDLWMKRIAREIITNNK